MTYQLAEEKLQLEAITSDATSPGPNQPKDLHDLSRYGFADRIAELEKGLVGSAHQSFENAIDHLKIANPGVELRTEGVHFLNFV